MEIQTFFLAEQITRVTGNRHDVRHAAIAFLECTPETPFPVRFTLPALVLLRREATFGDAPLSLRFDLVDEDGRPAGQPRRVLAEGVFPDGYRFFSLMAQIAFEFPKPGSYRLDVTVDQEFAGNVYSYNIDIVRRKEP
ncbi:MAG TPA: hypothetical protein VG013_13770 [Gemmataceae bacterium]|jgi:hypothetical protein|nr:hypothetical protein [Gemmataceae bacterium]